jgi:hypothetical protein
MGQRNNTGPTSVSDRRLVPVNYEQLTSLGSAAGLTAAKYDIADFAIIQAQDQDVRWRDDGTDPTTTVGMVLAAGTWFTYTGDLSAIKIIETAASAKLNVSYYRAM